MLSLIIPTYNCTDYLDETLDSVTAQLPDDYELIIVDDGSTDGTAGRLAEYREELKNLSKDNIEIILNEHKGVSGARNAGIQAAGKEFVTFMDCDDCLTEDFFEKQKADAECFSYEVNAPFYRPTHYVDITDLEEEKRRLARFHQDQREQEQITLSLNEFRGSQLFRHEKIRFAECYIKIDAYDLSESPDLLLKLYEINDDPKIMERIAEQGVEIKRVMPMNTSKVYDFIRDNFAATWADECMPSIMNGDCYVAVKDRQLLGFFAIDTPAKGFTGPVGVLPSARRMGISRALGLVGIKAMRDKGYKYAVSGRVHPWFVAVEKSLVGLMPIPGCAGSYKDML